MLDNKPIIITCVDHKLTNITSINNALSFFTKNVGEFDFYSAHPDSKDFKIPNGTHLDTQPNSATHAIIIGDKTSLQQAKTIITEFNIPNLCTRYKHVPVTRVINIKRNNCTDYVYIGRGSKWGNPHSHLTGERDRDSSIEAFKYDFERNLFINVNMKSDLNEIIGCVLGCSCKPLNCHGDILAAEANSRPFD